MRKLYYLSTFLFFVLSFQVDAHEQSRKTRKSDPEVKFQFSVKTDIDCVEFYHSDAERRNLYLDNSERNTAATKSKQKCSMKYLFGCEGATLKSDDGTNIEDIPGYINAYLLKDDPLTGEGEFGEDIIIEMCTQMDGKFVKG